MCKRHSKVVTFTGESWTVEQLENFWVKIDNIGKSWGLTYPKQQIELVSADQMIETIATLGAPCSYDHWSIGKEAIQMEAAYKKGQTGLALELVINSEPSIMYIMENNTLIQQGLVMAHAGIGHGSVYKNNFLFKEWTAPESILEYMNFAKKYVAECETKYGHRDVETLLDLCHALQTYSVSHHKRKRSKQKQIKSKILKAAQENIPELLETVPNIHYRKILEDQISKLESSGPDFPEENILYFLEKHSKHLVPWEREIVRITRKMAEYFYPQTKTKILHEGWATFIEYMVFNELYEQKHIDEGGYLEFLRDHSNIIYQPAYDSPYYSGSINPYSIGYNIFFDLYRMTHSPTKKDLTQYPEICNTRWQDSLMEVVKNYTDPDFISRYLTDNVINNMKLFSFQTDMENEEITINGTAAHHDTIREILSDELIMYNRVPRLEVIGVDGEGGLEVMVYCSQGKDLDSDSVRSIGYYLHLLWGKDVKLNYNDYEGYYD